MAARKRRRLFPRRRRCASIGPHGARCNFGPGHKLRDHHGEYHTSSGYRGESWPNRSR